MSLEELSNAVEDAAQSIDDPMTVSLDRQSRTELALLEAALGVERDELCRRAMHLLFRQTVDTGDLDFNLRQSFDVTYDEYLAGMTLKRCREPRLRQRMTGVISSK